MAKVQPAREGVFPQAFKNADQAQTGNINTVKEYFVPVVGENVVFADKIYGLPLSVDSLALYINTTIMEQAASEINESNRISAELMPEEVKAIKNINQRAQDWTEVMKIVPYLTVRQGDTISRSAIAMGLGSNIEQAPNIISSLLLQNNTKIVTDDNSAAFFRTLNKQLVEPLPTPAKVR